MALSQGPTPFFEQMVAAFNASAGSQTGSKITLVAPFRGRLLECGFIPNSLVTSATTMAVSVGDNGSSLASNFSQVITSTLGTFSSTVLSEGQCASAVPPNAVYVNKGDAIQVTTSGGQTSAVGALVYAIVRRG